MSRPSPLQNRVLPTGEFVVDPARGLFTGNRGILHRPDHSLGPARWTHPHWVTCTLTHPRGVHHGAMPERGWTALFFLDEAVALAAGHRPCGYCRRSAYRTWVAAWTLALGPTDRLTMDRILQSARVTRTRAQIRLHRDAATLPDGAFILWQDRAYLILGDAALPFSPSSYAPPLPRPMGRVTVLTPAPTLAVLAAGYRPELQGSAKALV